MSERQYKLVEPVAGFDEGDILDVTARFGNWHLYDVKLEPREKFIRGSVEIDEEKLTDVAEPVDATA